MLNKNNKKGNTMTKETQKQFWNLVDKGAVKVECKQACIDALNDTPNIDLDEFLAEAKDHQWIEEIDHKEGKIRLDF